MYFVRTTATLKHSLPLSHGNILAEQYSKCEGFSLDIALFLLLKYSVTGLKTLMPLPQPVTFELRVKVSKGTVVLRRWG